MADLKRKNTSIGFICITLIALVFCFTAKAQIITTVAGTGVVGNSGDGGQATTAQLNTPNSLAKDVAGNFYIADYSNNVIRKINTAGIITTFAGNNIAGYSGDGGQATLAQLKNPTGVLVDNIGNVYICDESNLVVRKVNTLGIITTIAGNHTAGYSGDGGQATVAQLNDPTGLALDAMGNLYIADVDNQVVRKIDVTGIITTIAGNGIAGYSGDGGQAKTAQLNTPIYVATDAANNIYIADAANNVIRKINTAGIITTFAGNHTVGYSGDGGQANTAELNKPEGVAIDAANNVYIGDWNNNVIRKVNTLGVISTIAGNGTAGFSGEGGIATLAELNHPLGIVVDAPCGQLYFADEFNARIRKVNFGPTLSANSPTICAGTTTTLTALGAATYTWSTGATTATITASPTVTTTYTVAGTNNNCTNTDTVKIIVDSVPNVIAHLTSTITPICNGDSIVLNGSGANTYSWTSISYTVTPADSIKNGIKFTVTTAGLDTFSVIGKDTITGCVNTATISVLVKQSPNIMVTPMSGTICPGGSVSFTVSAGGVTSYTWSPTSNLSPSANSTTITVSPTVSTAYQVMGTDTNGCISGNEAIVIIPQDSISVNSAVICLSNSVTLNASSIAVSYTWSPATGLSSTSGTSVIANPRNTTVYTISGTDAFGCMGVSTATVTVDSLPIISISKTPTITCSGQPAVLTASGASTYTWSTGAVGVTNTVSPTTNTGYTVVGTDTNGCSNTATEILLVNPLPPVAINGGATSVDLNLGQSITLYASGALTYSWTTGNVKCDSCATNIESPNANTQYCVAGTDINGCKAVMCLNVVVENICDIFIPDAFSPNGDGQNDEFKVYSHCIADLTLQVFDRWGNLVFTGSGLSAAWDGSYGGKLMNTGSYVYQLQYTLSNGKKTKTKGNFSLMR